MWIKTDKRICKFCNREFLAHRYKNTLFCSKKCVVENKKNKPYECKKHGIIEQTEIYYKRPNNGKSGGRSCKICHREIEASKYKEKSTTEEYNNYRKDYYAKNKYKLNQKSKKWREENYDRYFHTEKNRQERNREQIKIKAHQYYEKKKDQIIKRTAAWAKDNPDKVIIYRKRLKKKQIETLNDTYIKGYFTNKSLLDSNNVPNELIEVKRLQLKLKRKIKEINNGDKKC